MTDLPIARCVSVESIYKGDVIDVEHHRVALPNGIERTFEIARHRGAAAVVPLTAHDEVVLVRQLRYAASNSYLLEVPAGKLDGGEPPRACAERELREEAGLIARSLIPLVAIWMTPGFCTERIHLFLATDLEDAPAAPEEDEVLTVVRMPFREALAAIPAGHITDAKTIAALAAAAIHLGRLR